MGRNTRCKFPLFVIRSHLLILVNISNGKTFKLYCNTDIKPTNNIQIVNNVLTAEACAEICSTRADCGYARYAAKFKRCIIRPPVTSIVEKAFTNSATANGNTFEWVFVRDAAPSPPPPPPTSGDSNGTDNIDQTIPSPDQDGSNNLPAYDCTNQRDHGKQYTISGKTFELLCDHGNIDTGYLTVPVTSLTECADLCARDAARCGSAEFHVGSNMCELEPDGSSVGIVGYHLWVPKTCPSTPRPLAAGASPQITTDLTCPMNDGKIYQGVDGTWYYIQCCSDSAGAVIKGFETASSHQQCIDKCSASSECNSASYDAAASTNNCKLYGLGGYSTAHKPGVHHYYATEPPTVAANPFDTKRCSTQCPEADGQIFASPTGENFVMSCKKRHGTTYLKQTPDRYPTFASCMKACGAIPACLSVDYELKTQKCFFSTNAKNPTVAAAAFASAHSAGCAGAACGSSCNATGCDDDVNAGPLDAKSYYACDRDHGKPVTVLGVDFYVACQHGINSHPWRPVAAAADHVACVELCAADAACGGANWIGGASCFHHPDVNRDGSAVSVDQRLDSDAFVKVPGNLYSALV
ncbi:uncharacterized protein PG998_003082 [Apiospora kogelbergensis]|uniref:uncharacterized protein n=1 Tax=Apiospora kogelbergensis TaxID=1337665 RepID=UPI00312CFEA9